MIQYVDYQFGQGQTIEAAIKLVNKNESLDAGLIEDLMARFNLKNRYVVPVMGQNYKIPLIVGDKT